MKGSDRKLRQRTKGGEIRAVSAPRKAETEKQYRHRENAARGRERAVAHPMVSDERHCFRTRKPVFPCDTAANAAKCRERAVLERTALAAASWPSCPSSHRPPCRRYQSPCLSSQPPPPSQASPSSLSSHRTPPPRAPPLCPHPPVVVKSPAISKKFHLGFGPIGGWSVEVVVVGGGGTHWPQPSRLGRSLLLLGLLGCSAANRGVSLWQKWQRERKKKAVPLSLSL